MKTVSALSLSVLAPGVLGFVPSSMHVSRTQVNSMSEINSVHHSMGIAMNDQQKQRHNFHLFSSLNDEIDMSDLVVDGIKVANTDDDDDSIDDLPDNAAVGVPDEIDVLAEIGQSDDLLADLGDINEMEIDEEEMVELPTPDSFLAYERVMKTIPEVQKHGKDFGSSAVQVVIMSERITLLTKHMQNNPKDYHTLRGLIRLVNNRRKHLNYLYKKDVAMCDQLVAKYGIRFRAPNSYLYFEGKYATYPNTKKGQRPNQVINKALKKGKGKK